ncbi:MAG: hypothetical protein H0U16_06760 [Actinobacteria bacterium]|nr:hypothetical protein [Actinomycetota bacterium]
MILAHGIGGRSDLPVPLWLAMYAGGFAVVISFVALGAFWLTPRLTGPEAGRPLRLLEAVIDTTLTRAILRGLGVIAFVTTVIVSVYGTGSSASNPAPTWLYVWFWVGLVPASLLLGPVWRLLNPLRAFSRALAHVEGRTDGDWHALPRRISYWPAAVSLFVFVWLELVYQQSDRPILVAVFLLMYALAQAIAGSYYGPQWHARGDGFEVYSALFGSLAPVGRRKDGRVVLRNPLDGLASVSLEPGLIAVVCVLLGSTAFDGLTRTDFWSNITQDSAGLTNALLGTAGLAGSIAFIAITYIGATRASAALASRSDRRNLSHLEGRFIHSLIPIAVGYTIAHYFSLLVFQGQAGYILASDPLGRGWDLFGTADLVINYATISTTAIALVQVAAIVTGHVIGVVAAHDRAVALFSGADKTRAQYSLLGVMVLYTVGGIALLVGA